MKRITRASILIAIIFLLEGILPPGLGSAYPSALDPAQDLPPVVISDENFILQYWKITGDAAGGAVYTAAQEQTGGNPGSYLRISHRLPPVQEGAVISRISVTYVYSYQGYTPFLQGEIRAVDYFEDGIILSFPFPESFSTTVPVLEQNGRIFRTERFLRFIAQDGTHAWESKSLAGLTSEDFRAADGSGDRPNFIDGNLIRFGFMRTNSRSSTQPPVPSDQDLVIEQGVDNWRVTIHRDNTNRPPIAVNDQFILDGVDEKFFYLLDVTQNDRDPNKNALQVVEVTEAVYGSASVYEPLPRMVSYVVGTGSFVDHFEYTISDGEFTSSARVEVLLDCACSLRCLRVTGGSPLSLQVDSIDLPLMYRVRDDLLKRTPQGRRYVDMYYRRNPEILFKIMLDESLKSGAVATVQLWQDNLRSLVDGDGSAVITQDQVNSVRGFLDSLSAAASSDLKLLIGEELERLGPLDEYVGMTMEEARSRVIGGPELYLPLLFK